MSKNELGRLRASVIQHIAYTFSVYLGRKDDIGSSKEEHVDYINNAQRSLRAMDAPVNASDVWKDIGLQDRDLLKLSAETLRTMCEDCGVGDIGPNLLKSRWLRHFNHVKKADLHPGMTYLYILSRQMQCY
jgi:hypothetical protein